MDLASIRGRSGVESDPLFGSTRDPFGLDSGSMWDRSWVDPGTIRAGFADDPGSTRGASRPLVAAVSLRGRSAPPHPWGASSPSRRMPSLTSARAPMRMLATPAWPSSAAMERGVCPVAMAAFASARWSQRKRTNSSRGGHMGLRLPQTTRPELVMLLAGGLPAGFIDPFLCFCCLCSRGKDFGSNTEIPDVPETRAPCCREAR